MTKYAFVAHLADPFGIELPITVMVPESGVAHEITLNELAGFDNTVVTYDVSRLVEVFRRTSQRLPSCMVDVKTALRLLSGLPRDEGGEKVWDSIERVVAGIPNEADGQLFKNLLESRVAQPDRSEVVRLLGSGALALQRLWAEILQELEVRDEARRYFEFEIPVQQVFYQRQHSGIALDAEALKECIDLAKDDKYSAFRELAASLGFSPSGLNFRNVGDLLPQTDASHLGEFSSQANLENYFELAEESSSFASAFLRFQRADRDLAVLTRINPVADRIYPVFETIGTVTARITVIDPRLQQIRKSYRKIIAPDHGKQTIYLDYAQFEPGIMASLSEDDVLINAYNSTDLYEALSVQVFGNSEHRPVCKSIFLAYCYGMSVDNIAKVLAGSDFSLARSMQFHDAVSSFFARFPSLERFRQTCWEKLMRTGSIESLMGNRRVRKTQGALTNKERRWAVNQIVQGTASLIFKTAVIGIANTLGASSILLPMHDAVLLQYDPVKNKNDGFKATATDVMKAAFVKWCPNVRAKVVQTKFTIAEVLPPKPEDRAQLSLLF